MAKRVFLDWSRPLVAGLTDWLAAESRWEAGHGALDLSDVILVVPTAAAGRRLRQALALWADARGTGVLSPQIITPEVLITWGVEAAALSGNAGNSGNSAALRAHKPPLPERELAGRGEQVLAWASVLTGLNLDDWRELFPVDPVSQDVSWALGAAADVLKLRRTLEEGGHDLASAGRALGEENTESARWACLTRLEELAVRRLESGGWRDPVSARLAAAANPALPEAESETLSQTPPERTETGGPGLSPAGSHRRLVLAGLPDSIQLTRTALAAIETKGLAEVTVAMHAPESLAEAFDDWGRPLPEVWTERHIRFPKGNDTVSLTSRPEDAAGTLIRRLRQAEAAGGPGSVVMGSADAEVAAPLLRLAADEGIDVFDPEGLPLPEHEVSWVVKTLTRLLHSDAWAAAGQLLRVPEVLALAVRAGGLAGPGSGLRVLQDWDAFQAERLPRTLTQAVLLVQDWAEEQLAVRMRRTSEADKAPAISALPRVLGWLRHQLAVFQNAAVSTALTDFLETLYSGKVFAAPAERERFLTALTTWQEAVTAVERGAAVFLPALSAAGRLDLAAALVRDARLYTAHDDDAHAINGWLELPWQEAPHLIIAGMNEGMVPDSVLGDAWLPDSVRGTLSLKTNDTRLSRDSYLLTAMIESRRAQGSVRLLCGRLSAAGDPLKPSRLLLRCPADDLPSRALHLFPRDLEDAQRGSPDAPWSRAWRLQVPPMRENAPVFQKLNVTAFGDYLQCPFRFYLKHVLGMEPYDSRRGELDARMAGNLFHSTMEDFHREPELRDSQDAGEIAAFLHDAFDLRSARMFGGGVAIPVTMQLEVLRNCLTKAAEIHAEESAKGWRFREVEMQFPTLIRMDGTEIRGRIDLIQYHPEHGYRILDYKTSSKAKRPMEAHLQPVRSRAERERRRGLPGGEWAAFESGDQFWLWRNLQLPLYARIMRDHYGGAKVSVGYISLPRAVSESRLEVWEDLDEPMLESAWECAGGVIRSIREGIFWPPAAAVKYDDFESLIFEDAASSFDPDRLLRLRDLIATGAFVPETAPLPRALPEE
jgi:ATP-dependent helicase/nuclease subunit B